MNRMIGKLCVIREETPLTKCPHCKIEYIKKHIHFWCGFKKWLNCFLGNHIYKAFVWDNYVEYECQNCNYIRIIHTHEYGYGEIRSVNDKHQLYDSELRRTGKYFNS